MMCLSQTAGYAIHALGLVAQSGGRLWLIRDVARASGIPKAYLAKIVNQLAREGLIAAKRGARGGIYLTRQPGEITLLEVVEAIEGKRFMAECMLSMDDCSAPCICPTHEVWGRIRTEITEALRCTTLAQILGAKGASETSPGKRKRRKMILPRNPASPRRTGVLIRKSGKSPGVKRPK